jgi:hypothetical protein
MIRSYKVYCAFIYEFHLTDLKQTKHPLLLSTKRLFETDKNTNVMYSSTHIQKIIPMISSRNYHSYT